MKIGILDIQKALKSNNLDAVYIGSMKNVRYLTGFTGSSGFVLITKNREIFFTDFRYREQAGIEVSGWEIEMERGKRIKVLRDFTKKLGIRRLGFETSLSYEFYELLQGLPLKTSPLKNLVENLRKIKSAGELGYIKEAAVRAEEAYLRVKPRIKPGARERELALRLEEQLKKGGCKSIPFDIIVASGKNSAMPHAQPTEKKIEKGDFVIIDWGGESNGYYSDMTRTLLMAGKALSEKIEIYNTVNAARKLALRAVKEGAKTREIDAAARNAIRKAGYGEFFGHGTGHGVGLDVHEEPRVSFLRSERVRRGMVFTIEPGIYVPQLGGVRIEDMVAIKENESVLLTTLSRELEIIKA